MIRATSMAAAFVDAAVKVQCNPEKGIGLWTARRTILNAQRPGFAVVVDRPAQVHSRIPRQPEQVASAIKSFNADLVDDMAQVFVDIHLKLTSPARDFLSDEELLGLD
jgi:hypothetical protein